MGRDEQPIYVLNQNIDRKQGRSAQRSNIAAAKAVAEAVRSTLGPSGSDKMLVSGEGKSVIITNDGATILREIDCQHPAGQILVEVAEVQEEVAYDGTTSSVIIAGSLLGEAETLIGKGIHPTTICKGYRKAGREAAAYISSMSDDVGLLMEKMSIPQKESLQIIAKTALTGKSAESEIDLIAELAIDAVMQVADGMSSEDKADLSDIKILTFAGASFADSHILAGVLLEKEPVHTQMPDTIEGKILCLTSDIEVRELKQEATLSITDPNALEQFLAKEEAALLEMVDFIVRSNAKIVLCKGAIDELAQHYLHAAGIMACNRVKMSDLELVRRTTGANLVNSLKDIRVGDLGEGRADKIEYGEHKCIQVSSSGNIDAISPVTVVLRGVSSHTAEELERAFDDAVGVVSVAFMDNAFLVGGGAAFMYLSKHILEMAKSIGGREQMAIEAFAHALENVPITLAENAGADAVGTMIGLRSAVSQHQAPIYGVNIDGNVADMLNLKVIEPTRVISSAVKSATEAAVSILRIDDVLSMKPAGGPMGGMPSMAGMGGL